MNNIIYSCFIPNKNKLYVAKEFLDICIKLYSDFNIYVGIQKDSDNSLIELLEEYKSKLKIKYSLINDSNYVNSDVSGFQKALELYYNDYKINGGDKDKNGITYFNHSKGATSNNNEIREFYNINFFNKKEEIYNKLYSSNEYGCYSHYLTLIKNNPINKPYSIIMKEFNNTLSRSVFNYFYTNTIFCLKTFILDEFLSNVKEKFFNNNLLNYSDRWFFERDFIHIVDMQGYEPLFKELTVNYNFNNYGQITTEDYNNYYNEWKKIK